MIRFTAIRLVEIAATLVLMSFVIYGLIGLMPGDPIDLMRQADPRMSAADVARLTAAQFPPRRRDQPVLLCRGIDADLLAGAHSDPRLCRRARLAAGERHRHRR